MDKKVLIIDDNDADIKILTRFLNKAGFTRIISASEAYQGTQLAHKEKPDLILLDISLPTGGGINVLKNLKLSAHTKETPVIIVSGSQNEEHKKQATELGVSIFIEKSSTPDKLLTAIRELFEKTS